MKNDEVSNDMNDVFHRFIRELPGTGGVAGVVHRQKPRPLCRSLPNNILGVLDWQESQGTCLQKGPRWVRICPLKCLYFIGACMGGLRNRFLGGNY